MDWFLIVNPVSGNKKIGKTFQEIKRLLTENSISFSYRITKYAQHEIEITQQAIRENYKKFIVVGGDGTLHHVVNAVMLQKYIPSKEIILAIIPVGTGNDWIKTYAIPKNLKKAIKVIAQQQTIYQDIGKLKSKQGTFYFNNVAGLGFDGYVVNKLNKLKKLGSISYIVAGFLGLIKYKKTSVRISVNNQEFYSDCLLVIFGICKYSGGGMQFTEGVNPSNGLLDITIAKDFSFLDLLYNLPKLYNGKITNHKKVRTLKTKEITVNTNNSAPFIQADGEIIGVGSVNISIEEKAIQFVINSM